MNEKPVVALGCVETALVTVVLAPNRDVAEVAPNKPPPPAPPLPPGWVLLAFENPPNANVELGALVVAGAGGAELVAPKLKVAADGSAVGADAGVAAVFDIPKVKVFGAVAPTAVAPGAVVDDEDDDAPKAEQSKKKKKHAFVI